MALGGALGPVLVARDARHFAWQAWHLVTSTFVSRGRRGTISHSPWFCVAGVALMALGGALGPVFVARDAAALCVAGVALDDIHLRFTWQAWRKETSTLFLRGRRGTIFDTPLCHTPSFTPNFVTHHLSRTIFHTPLCHPPSLTYHLSHTTLSHTHTPSHTTVLTSRSFTASFPFPSFPVPATTFDAHYWKKLTCGVIRSFNFGNSCACMANPI